MKCICQVCLAELEVATVTIEGKPAGISLVPHHPPQRGAIVRRTSLVNQKTGKIIETYCNGSLRPVVQVVAPH